MKRLIALLALLLLLTMTVGGNLVAEEDPIFNGGGGALGGGGGGAEDEPDGDDHPWGGDQMPGGDKEIITIKAKRSLAVTLTGIPQIDYFLRGMYLSFFGTYSLEPAPVTKYYTRKSR